MDKNFAQTIDQYIHNLGEVVVDDERLEGYRVYYVKAEVEDADQAIFAIVKKDSLPVFIDLACDRKLARNLRDKYESVVPSKLMDETSWNRIICSGQLSETEVLDLVNLSWQLINSQFEV